MARLFIHIGAHKTGTSYLQNLFFRNRKRLAQAGLHYPNIGPNDAHHALAGLWMDVPGVPPGFFDKHSPADLWDNLTQTYAKGPGTVFLSAENFSRGYPDVVDMRDLARRTAAFDEVQVIYTMRQQAPLTQSLWLQVSKSSRVLAMYGYINRALEENRSGGVRIDHDHIYERLLHGFAPDQITLLDYSQISRAPGGIGQVFLDLLGCDLRASNLSPPPPDQHNTSPDPLAFLAATRVTGDTTVPEAGLVNQISAVMDEHWPGRPRTVLLWSEYVKFHRKFAPRNAALVDRVQYWQPGFTFDDPLPPENMLYRGDLDGQMWSQIAAALYTPQKSERMSRLRSLLTGRLF